MSSRALFHRLRPAASRLTPSRTPHPSSLRAMASAPGPSDQQLDKSTPEDVWKQLLSAEEYYVLRQKGTERPGTGPLNKNYADGEYNCAGCGNLLFTSDMKFDSGCGWPAFWDEVPGSIDRHTDSDGMRTEITCSSCGGHLGHVLMGEGFGKPKDQRHCVNSVSIRFKPK